MDDGGRACYTKEYPRRGLVFNTQGFPKNQVELLCQGLRNRYLFECWLRPNKNGYVIVISSKSSEKLLTLIRPFCIESMIHKFSVGDGEPV